MGYDYESLLDEHFQHFCQALLLTSFPKLQCMPVGMPDGGRDAMAPSDLRGTIIFQVKFARSPESIADPVKWIEAAIGGELPKINRLAERGASEYVLLTNVRGSSHLDVGRIDKVNTYLEQTLTIPSACWWRDDLDRRLDNNYDLKLRFPSLLTGTDLLRLVWEREDRRDPAANTALRAYLSVQSEQDKSVRFKQAELQASSLFEIFVDVPVTLTERRSRVATHRNAERLAMAARRIGVSRRSRDEANSDVPEAASVRSYMTGSDGEVYVEYHDRPGVYETARLGAADLLLDHVFFGQNRFIVLEGAPGQGKSTLTQYLGQIHRTRILPGGNLDGLPIDHAQSSISVPLRLELRDLAQWLNGQNPWAKEPETSSRGERSLETALAAHIHHLAGFASYSVDNLHELLSDAPVLVLLDGLDEVADLDDRRHVVEEILSAITRLEAIARDLRVVITSRPTVFSSSATFPEDRFFFLKLAPIHRELALEYTDRWANARGLSSKDKAEVRSVLVEKMNAPHMAELAKNTMQLSILLSLIYLRGASLPDKRTELYDTYVDTFLNRESEKSAIVRNNRQLLTEIHWYLAFYIHSNTEGQRSNGRIRVAELRKVLSDYLTREGRPLDLIDDLVIGTVERVVALVSRVEGTYEFEVQPLREYFAARFLYETASYSPAGRAMKGTKPDRFDAIARNPYWLNVTRFYAGCFSKGELLDLAERVCTLITSEDLRHSTYPRSLAVAFLQDWVFTQSVSATAQVVAAVFDDLGIRVYGRHAGGGRVDAVDIDSNFMLSAESGGTHLAEILWERLKREKRRTERSDCVGRLILRHANRRDLADRWMAEAKRRRRQRLSGWFSIGRFLGVFEAIPPAQVVPLAIGESDRSSLLNALLRGGCRLDGIPELPLRDALNEFLQTPRSVSESMAAGLAPFLGMISPRRWAYAVSPFFYGTDPLPLLSENAPLGVDAIAEAVRRTLTDDDLAVSLKPWSDAIAVITEAFGDTWVARELAIISAAVRNPSERGAGAKRLLSSEYALTERARFAKRRPKNLEWWLEQSEEATSDLDQAFWIVMAYAWTDPSTLRACVPTIDKFMRAIEPSLRTSVVYACRRATDYSDRCRKPIGFDADAIRAARVSVPTLSLLSHRINVHEDWMMESMVRAMREPWIASALLRIATFLWLRGKLDPADYLVLAEKAHSAGGRVDFGISADAWRSRQTREMARNALDSSWGLPDTIIHYSLQFGVNRSKFRPVLEIATEEDWFDRGRADG